MDTHHRENWLREPTGIKDVVTSRVSCQKRWTLTLLCKAPTIKLVCHWIVEASEDMACAITSTSSEWVRADSAMWFSNFAIAFRTTSAAVLM